MMRFIEGKFKYQYKFSSLYSTNVLRHSAYVVRGVGNRNMKAVDGENQTATTLFGPLRDTFDRVGIIRGKMLTFSQ